MSIYLDKQYVGWSSSFDQFQQPWLPFARPQIGLWLSCMALDIDNEEANNENLDGLDDVALDIDTVEASNETEDFAVQFGLQKDK